MTAPAADTDTDTDAAPAAPRPARQPVRRRWLLAPLWGLALAALLALSAAGVALWWTWHQETALPWLLQRVPGLDAQGVQGTLQSGEQRIARIEWQLPAALGRLRMDGLQLEGLALHLWPRPGQPLGLSLRALRADRVQFDSGPPSGQPLQLPTNLRLPLDLQVAELRVGELRIDQLPPLRQLHAALALGADGGRLHRLSGASATLALGDGDAPPALPIQLQAELQIGVEAPLALEARATAQRVATADKPGWQATLRSGGPLARLAARVDLSGEARAGAPTQALQARATLLPFAAWPLADLALQTEALDLAALSPRLPQTQLGGSAEVITQGLDQPASVTVTLRNGLPGPWDRGRLPVLALDLTASGTPRQTDRLTLQRFELLLGDAPGARGAAGRLSGQGQWQADTLALDLELDGLRPARLHRRAADLLLSGPIQLQASGLPVPAASTAASTASTAPGGVASAAPATPGPERAATPQLAVVARLEGRLLDGTGLPVQLQLEGDLSAQHLRLLKADAKAGAARVQGTLDARALPAGWQLRGRLALRDFDPRPWWRGAELSAWRRGPHRLNATLAADLLWQPAANRVLTADTLALDRLLAAVDGSAALQIDDSLLAGVALGGSLKLHSRGPVADLDGALELAGNRLTLSGHGGGAPAADAWQIALRAPALAKLAPLGEMLAELAPAAADAWPRSGALSADLATTGRWPALRAEGRLAATDIGTALGSLQSATLSLRAGGVSDAPLDLQVQAQGLVRGGQRLDRLQAGISGSLRDHALRLLVDSPARPPAWTEALLGAAGTGTRFEAEARGQWSAALAGASGAAGGGAYRWQAMTLKAGARDAQGGSRPWLAAQGLAGTLALDTAGSLQSLQADPGRVQLLSTALNWRQLQWRADGGAGQLDVAAVLETIEVAPLLARLQPAMGWSGTLTLGGRIDIHSAARLDADIVLERLAGDLRITDDLEVTQSLGLTDLRLALSAHDGVWQLAQGLAGRRVGTLAGAQVLRTSPERRWPEPGAPLQGLIEARVADLGVWGAWLPPGWRLSGRLDTVAQFGGTLGAPELKGSMRGTDLGARNLLQGVSLTAGQLAVVLEGDEARIEQFSFKGGDGRLTATGDARLGAEPSATLRVVAEQFRALGRVDRRLVVSGDALLRLDRERLQLDGALAIDEGLFDIGRAEAPTLDSDVVVHRAAAASAPATAADNGRAAPAPAPVPAPLRQARVDLKLGLGQALRLRGKGVDTLLRGDLVLTSPGGRPALNGTVRAHEGLYAAYGQKLEISRGEFTFNGPLDNPRLDVLAVRPNLDVVVGVTIVGSASNPRIRLYSEPEMAEYDKLSWLMLGRASEGLGSADAALLQRAAYALLAGDSAGQTDQLLGALGLTEFSVRQTEGDSRDTVISLGRQLSRRWWVGYERGVNATTGTWQVIYRVAQRFTLRAQSGEENALDLIWTWRW